MSQIKISKLEPTGLELFEDSESFLNQLTFEEISVIKGGFTLGGGGQCTAPDRTLALCESLMSPALTFPSQTM